MQLPRYLQVLRTPPYIKRLYFSIWSGFGVTAAFLGLALLGILFDVIDWRWEFLVIGLGKGTTNMLAWASLRRRRLIITANTLNVVADVSLMTYAIYLTGGPRSPALSIYLIEIAVSALLTNTGVTVAVAVGSVIFYSTMSLMVQAGILAPTAALLEGKEVLTVGYVVTDIGLAVLLIGITTFFTTLLVHWLRRNEEQLERRTADLVEAQRQRSQFLTNITHELRTPLFGIMSLSEMLDTGIYGDVTERQKESHASIRENAANLLRLIDDLLEATRIDAGQLEFRGSDVEVEALVTRVVASVQGMFDANELEATVEVAPGLPTLHTDQRKLGQVLVNLLANAAKFTPEGGRVTVRAALNGHGAVRIEVEDTGIGIPAEELERIFEAFRQVDGTLSRNYGGVGLGLSLVRSLTAFLGGEVSVESTVGEGSRFAVTLPVQRPSTDQPATD